MDNKEYVNLEEKELLSIIESILFAIGDKVDIDVFKEALGINTKYARTLLKKLQDDYDYNMRGLRLIRTNDTYQLTTRKENFVYIKKVMTNINSTTLSQAALETLAIIAYKQPVTRLDIENIRGVKSSSSLDLLISRGLVVEAGKLKDVIGKPMTFKTTDEFLRLADIEQVKDLPEFENFVNDIEKHLEDSEKQNGEQLMFTEKIQ